MLDLQTPTRHRYEHTQQITTSKYWQAHAKHSQPMGGDTRNKDGSSSSTSYHNPGIANDEAARMTKRARIGASYFTHVPTCKGNCPKVWTIESYCPYCHGAVALNRLFSTFVPFHALVCSPGNVRARCLLHELDSKKIAWGAKKALKGLIRSLRAL